MRRMPLFIFGLVLLALALSAGEASADTLTARLSNVTFTDRQTGKTASLTGTLSFEAGSGNLVGVAATFSGLGVVSAPIDIKGSSSDSSRTVLTLDSRRGTCQPLGCDARVTIRLSAPPKASGTYFLSGSVSVRVDPAHGGVADLRSGQLIVSNLVSNLSPGCAKLSAMGTITINPDDVPVSVVSDTFNVNEVIRFTINPVSGDASVSSSGIGLEGQILPRAEVFDISNQSSFILTVTGAGRGTIAIQNGDTRQRVMRITLSCAITLPTATKSTPPQGIPRACQSYFNLAQQTPCGANGNCTGRRQLLCIYQTCLKNGGRMPLTPAESQQCSRAEDLRTPLVPAHASRECQYPAAQAFARDVR